jgi:polyisoprenoid-binding protein YceI
MYKTATRLAGLALAASLSFSSSVFSQDDTVSYTLTRQYGSVLFRVMQQQYLNLVGRFDNYSATLVMDFEEMSNSRLNATVQMGSLSMTDGDVVETLVNSSVWFNAPLFPEATFTTTSVDVTGDMTADFHGELTFVGVKKPWTLHVQFYPGSDGELTGSSIGMMANGSFNRTDFGLNQYMNMADDPVSIEVNVKFNRD